MKNKSWEQLIKEVTEWQKSTFPLANKANQTLKLEEEIIEFNEARTQGDHIEVQKELADVIIVCWFLSVLGSPIGQMVYEQLECIAETEQNLWEEVREAIQKKFEFNRDHREFIWNEELGVYKGHAKK